MGNLITSGMQRVTEKQMEFQLQAQKMQMERQIEMQNQIRIRMQAAAIARARDMFTYVGTFYGLLFVGLTGAAVKRKNGALLAPLIPLSVIVAYHYDLSWGDKMPRIQGWAEEIMAHEPHMLGSPHGMPTVEDIDNAIKMRSLSSLKRD